MKPPPDSGFPSDVKGPYEERCLYPEPFLTYLPGSPIKGPSPEALCTEPLQRETLHPWSLLHPSLKSLVDEPLPGSPAGPPRKELPTY